jgi:hypothetical protein
MPWAIAAGAILLGANSAGAADPIGNCQTSSGKKVMTKADCDKARGSWTQLFVIPQGQQQPKASGSQPAAAAQASGASCSCEELRSLNGGRFFSDESACVAHVKRNNPKEANPGCSRKVKAAITEARSCNLRSEVCYKGFP